MEKFTENLNYIYEKFNCLKRTKTKKYKNGRRYKR